MPGSSPDVATTRGRFIALCGNRTIRSRWCGRSRKIGTKSHAERCPVLEGEAIRSISAEKPTDMGVVRVEGRG